MLGVTRSTTTFSQFLMRLPVERTLDLGTGGGYLQSMPPAQPACPGRRLERPGHRDGPVQRPAQRLANVERGGEPVRADRRLQFDLIVSNPPFVVSPEGDCPVPRQRPGGRCDLREDHPPAPAYLVEGGFAQILCNWARIAGKDWLERLTGWFEGSGCDAWILHTPPGTRPTMPSTGWSARPTISEKDSSQSGSTAGWRITTGRGSRRSTPG